MINEQLVITGIVDTTQHSINKQSYISFNWT
ncbi:hypothetical protein [Pasteurella multocida]